MFVSKLSGIQNVLKHKNENECIGDLLTQKSINCNDFSFQ